MKNSLSIAGGLLAVAFAIQMPVHAQDGVDVETSTVVPDIEESEDDALMGPTVFDGDWLSVGIGGAYSPSYTGSDAYRFSVLPIVQGSLGGIDVNPRPGGLAFDFLPDADDGPGLDLGIAARLRNNRTDIEDIDDPVVETLGELDTAFEVGPTAGVSFPGVLNPFDSLSFSVDARWDVAGAHEGFSANPSITYFTPLSRAIVTSLSIGAEYADSDFNDYYFSVSEAGSAVSGLPQFEADGGINSVSANLLAGFDLSGDATDGGLAIVTIAGYSRLVGDAKDTPLTSIRGDADQFFVAAGIGYTF